MPARDRSKSKEILSGDASIVSERVRDGNPCCFSSAKRDHLEVRSQSKSGNLAIEPAGGSQREMALSPISGDAMSRGAVDLKDVTVSFGGP